MRSKEVSIHLVFGGFELFLLYISTFLLREVVRLDAGPILKALIMNQCFLVMVFAGATWAATTLWARENRGVSWLSPSTTLTPSVRRWRRITRWVGFALFANLALAGALIKTDW